MGYDANRAEERECDYRDFDYFEELYAHPGYGPTPPPSNLTLYIYHSKYTSTVDFDFHQWWSGGREEIKEILRLFRNYPFEGLPPTFDKATKRWRITNTANNRQYSKWLIPILKGIEHLTQISVEEGHRCPYACFKVGDSVTELNEQVPSMPPKTITPEECEALLEEGKRQQQEVRKKIQKMRPGQVDSIFTVEEFRLLNRLLKEETKGKESKLRDSILAKLDKLLISGAVDRDGEIPFG